jgi:hypothetical protein
MGNSVAGRNAAAAGMAGVAGYASLHTADPGTTGASEVAGGTYARKAVTWAAASGGSDSTSASVQFNVPAGTTISHCGLWSALSGGTYYGGGALSATETFAAAAPYDLNTVTIAAT